MKIEFKKIIAKNTNDIKKLCNLLKKSFNENIAGTILQDNIEYLLSVLEFETIKNEIHYKEKEFFFIIANNTCVGYIELHKNKDKLFIDSIHIKNKFIKQNYKNQAIKFIEQKAKEENIQTIVCLINKNLLDTIAFFRNENFSIIKLVTKYFGNGIYMYCYQLEKDL